MSTKTLDKQVNSPYPVVVVSTKPLIPKVGAKGSFDPVDNSALIEEIRKANYHFYSA
jgi:hypothetical protein